MERKLLLLGLLRVQEMHGYQLNEIIDKHVGMSLQIKKATAYDLLRKMAEDGWITFYEDQAGNRPPRRVYAITDAGEAAFQVLLRDSLAGYETAEFASDISLAFLDALPLAEALPLLERRRSVIAGLRAELAALAPHPGSMQLVVDHQQRHLETELDWIDEVMARLTTEAKSDE